MSIRRARPISGFRMVREAEVLIPNMDQRKPIRNPKDVVAILEPMYGDADVEVFGFIALDAQHRMFEGPCIVTRGILNSSLVHPGEVFRQALTMHAQRAAAIILFHNHPSGDPNPSADDRSVTNQLVAAGRMLDIPVHDHIIVAHGRYCSFAEAGLM